MDQKFNEYKALNLPEISESILEFWNKENVFEESMAGGGENGEYVFYEGPPSANGMPGIHHVMARTIKDIYPRFKTMKGFRVKRKAGWDTHGLPIELGVEKELGITKEDIGKKISIEEYNEACKKAVMRYTDVWNQLTAKMGYWVDMRNPYITYKTKYMESVWWLLKQIYDKGLLYKGYTVQPYSPKAGTGLSSHELNQPGTYQDVTDTTVTAQFKALKSTLPAAFQAVEEEVYFLAWTTTPWTLPSNTALTVGPKIEYSLVATYNQYTFERINVVIATALISKQFGKKFVEVEDVNELKAFEKTQKTIPYIVLNTVKGEELVEARYEQLMPYVQPYQNPENAFRVISGNFVTTEDGTGIVHTAPTFGADDAMAAKQATPEVPPMLILDENQQAVPLVDLTGKFREELGPFGGKYVKNAYYDEKDIPEKSIDVEIAIQLKIENKAFKVEKYVHSYPNCWRTDKPILYYPLNSWFIKVTAIKDRMHELNTEINWKPKSTGEGRFGNWLANANDWNLSRSRYWGIPLPIWRTEDHSEELIIGSVEELKTEIDKAVAAGLMKENPMADFVVGDMSDENYDQIDLHKHIVDDIVLCASNGQAMYRETDLIDVWFDSGSMPYAQWHYPFENKEYIDEAATHPADFIAEGVDQTRGWFYTLHAISTMVFDKVAYKNVVSNGLVLDKEGKKMSKRLGNAVDPFETLKNHGADATRWYMISNANPWDNLKFDIEGVQEVKRKFFGTLYNTYSFLALYANIDGFTFKEDRLEADRLSELDRWILSELNSLISAVDEAYEDYDATKATRMISYFVQENLSNWYVRLGRRRFWKDAYGDDKLAAYQTLTFCLFTLSKLMAPVAPFFAERLYLDLVQATGLASSKSVHLASFPTADKEMIDKALEAKMQLSQRISSLVLSIRQKEKLKVRQPLRKVMIPVDSEEEKNAISAVAHLIKNEVNVKEIELLEDASDILVKQIKPNFKVLGPKFGKDMKAVAQIIQNFEQEDIHQIEKEGVLTIQVEDSSYELTTEDVIISNKDIEGWLVASSGQLTVALDVNLDDDLIKEGIARELVNRIQNIRKDSGFEVTDRVDVYFQGSVALEAAIKSNESYIKTETLCENIYIEREITDGNDVEFDDIKTSIKVLKR